MNRIITPVEVRSFSELKDHSIRITIYTNELTDDEFLVLRRMQGLAGFMALQTEAISGELTERLDDLDVSVYDKPKSKSQELRTALWRLWKDTSEDIIDFDKFYNKEMNKITEHYIDKLN